jgi:hypothetical protein
MSINVDADNNVKTALKGYGKVCGVLKKAAKMDHNEGKAHLKPNGYQ